MKIDGNDYEALRLELVKELDLAPAGSQQRVTILDSLVLVKIEMDRAAEKNIPKPQGRRGRSFFENLFAYHTPTGDQPKRYNEIRQIIKEACIACVEKTPESAEQTLAIRSMHMAMMHFNSSIALNEPSVSRS
jgi:hypothetical protein